MTSSTEKLGLSNTLSDANKPVIDTNDLIDNAFYKPTADWKCIKDVWSHNLEEEFKAIRTIINEYKYIAMDTEFPGVVARPFGLFRSPSDYQYHLLRCNVNLLRVIQLGLTFFDDTGRTPPEYSTWQFNFKFNLYKDMYAQNSIDLLRHSGIQFQKHENEGIDHLIFAELLMTSGIVLMDNVTWLSFHSGYDFGYMIRLLSDSVLPFDESEFFELVKIFFPNIFDVKYIMKCSLWLKGGLQEVADHLELRRIGPQHQAGSDSLLTGMTFFKMKDMYFDNNIDDEQYNGKLYGLACNAYGSSTSLHQWVENDNTEESADNSS